jgi:hypothetical protein
MAPKVDTAASANSRTWAGSVTSVGTASARAPSASQSRAACSSRWRRLAARTTLAPRVAKALAVASPMPLEAPVITTVASPRLSMIPVPLFDPRPTNRQACSSLLPVRARPEKRRSAHRVRDPSRATEGPGAFTTWEGRPACEIAPWACLRYVLGVRLSAWLSPEGGAKPGCTIRAIFSHRRPFDAWLARLMGNPKMARTCARRRPPFARWNSYRRFGAVPVPEEG